jgi:methionyl-tRNA formyltransferase
MGEAPKKTTSQPIIFFGTEDFSVISLERLIKDGYTIAAVVTKTDSRRGRGHHVVEPIIKTVAKAYQIPVWQPERLKDIIGPIKQLQPVTGVLVSYGRIIPAEIIDLFHPGIINVHPSL